MAKDPTVKRVPGKSAGQRHMKKKGKAGTGKGYLAKSTMGTGKVDPKASGAMGKNQSTGDGGASDW